MNNFNTQEEFYLNNTFITSSHFFKTSKFYFIRNFDALKKFLIILKYLRIACERLFDNVIFNKYFFKSAQSWRHSRHYWNWFLIRFWIRSNRVVSWKQTKSWLFDAWCSKYHIKFRLNNLTEYEYSLKNSSVSTYLTTRCALFMFAYLRTKFAT